jgi:O-antigen/teichoic acid export membrane protein
LLIKHILWDYFGRFSLVFANLAITAVLSRLLSPSEYGIIGIVLAISTLATIFLEFGFNSAIVQHPDPEPVQLNTIFAVVLAAGIALYTAVFFISPAVARFYDLPELTELLRISGLSFIINAFNLVPNSLIIKNMRFKEQSIRNVSLTVVAGSLAIVLALAGWGVWALVVQTLLSALLLVGVNIRLTGWLPGGRIQLRSIVSMFHYSKYLFLSGVLDAVFTRFDTLLIGKAINTQTVGFYSRAKGMENMIQGITTSSLNAVMFPYFSKMQEDPTRIVGLFNRFFHMIAALIFLFAGLAYINAPWGFRLLFGPQWDQAALYYRILAMSAFAFPLSALMLSVVSAMGNSKDFFRAEVGKKALFIPAFLLIFHSIEAFLYGWVIIIFLAFLINLYYLRRSIPIRVSEYAWVVFRYTLILACFLALYQVFMQWSALSSFHLLPALVSSISFVGLQLLSVRWISPNVYQLAGQQFYQLYTRLLKRPTHD